MHIRNRAQLVTGILLLVLVTPWISVAQETPSNTNDKPDSEIRKAVRKAKAEGKHTSGLPLSMGEYDVITSFDQALANSTPEKLL
ncbi:MAG TPA: hypothetical protein VN622_01240 [Clostridia bacterium]|nr:hypothetical protein [Clostridia bacterium]